MTTLKKSSLDADAIDMLVVTTECARVLVVDVQTYKVVAACQLPKRAVPVFVHASGLYDVDYRLLLCCRNGCVYTVRRGVTSLVGGRTLLLI